MSSAESDAGRFDLAPIRAEVAGYLDLPADELDPDDDLLALGLDSLAVMRLASRWTADGADVSFADLVEGRSLRDWHQLLLAAVAPAEQQPTPGTPPPGERDPARHFGLTGVQRAYWFGRADGQPLGGVGSHFCVEFDHRPAPGASVLDPDRLQQAVASVVARHPMLRARFSSDGEQHVAPDSPWPGVLVEDPSRIEEVREQLAHTRMDAAAGELIEVRCFPGSDGRTRTLIKIEMLVSDAQSFGMFLDEIATAYGGQALAPVEVQFADYVESVDAARQPAVQRARAHWQDRLPQLPADGPALPYRSDPREVSGHRTEQRSCSLDAGQVAALTRAGRTHGLTLSAVFLAAYADAVGRYADEPHFLLTLPVYGRDPGFAGVDRLVGDFTNLLLVDVDLSTPRDFWSLAAALQQQLHASTAHAAYSGIDVLRDLSQREGRPVLAPVVLTSAIGVGELFGDRVRGVLGEPVWSMSQNPQVTLDCQITERRGGLHLHWDATAELFPPGMLDAMFDLFVHTLLDPTGVDLPLAQRATRQAVNDTGHPHPADPLAAAVFRQAEVRPDAVALRCAAATLSFAELRQRAYAVAGDLVDRGVQPGDLVGVHLPRGLDQAVAVFAVLAAGAAYLPLGVELPPARRERIVAGAGVRLVLDTLPDPDGVRPLTAPVPVDPGGLAYVIYTSGSTGEPKGVEISHAAAVNTCAEISRRWRIGPDDVLLALSALDFDLSVYDLFGALGAGAEVVLLAEGEQRSPERWLELAAAHGVTVWNSVPALLDVTLTARERDLSPGLDRLRVVLLSGDWIGLDLPERLRRGAPEVAVVAMGGATEAAIWSNAYDVGRVDPSWTSIPYGFPLSGQRFRVVDRWGRDAPDGVAGELWIGGAGVALGYRGDPELTAQKFPGAGAERWYRTGDLGRYWPDGTLEFLGRRDHQIKLRGHRIELGEVEAALLAHPQVRRAVATVVQQPHPHLAAAVASSEPIADAGLREHLLDQLPYAMVPEVIQVLPELPRTANGKIDRAAVINGLRDQSGTTARLSEDDPAALAALRSLVAALLELAEAPPADANFFALGGDSLTATRLLTRLETAGLSGGDLRQLLRRPVLADFALTLAPSTATGAGQLRPDPEHADDVFPATAVQWAYWLGRQGDFALGQVGTNWYWEFDGAGVDLDRLEEAVNVVVARHPMLRAVFDDNGRQRVLPEVGRLRITRSDDPTLAGLPGLRQAMSHRVGDPGRWPLLEVQALRHGGDRTRLAIRFDYLVVDALSIATVLAEIGAVYAEPGSRLPPLELTFRDYLAAAEPSPAERAAAEDYWAGRLATLPAAPALPLAADPGTIDTPRFVRREVRVEPDRWSAIVAEGRRHGLTPAAVVLTAYALVLARRSATPELTLNVTQFDRRDLHPQVSQVVGDFTSLILVPFRPVAGADAVRLVADLQADLWAAMQHRSVSALELMRDLARHTDRPTALMPVVFTSALGVGPGITDSRYPWGEQVWGVSQTPQVWLDNQVTVRDGALVCAWDAVDGLFGETLLPEMVDDFAVLLAELAEAAASGWDGWVPQNVPTTPEHPTRAAAVSARPERTRPVQGPAEMLLAELWQRQLELPGPPGAQDNFFALGGDSLSATRMLQQLARDHGIELTFRQLVATPRIADLAPLLGAAALAGDEIEEGAL